MVAVTVAPGTAAPVASVTEPEMFEVPVWADTVAHVSVISNTKEHVIYIRLYIGDLPTLKPWAMTRTAKVSKLFSKND